MCNQSFTFPPIMPRDAHSRTGNDGQTLLKNLSSPYCKGVPIVRGGSLIVPHNAERWQSSRIFAKEILILIKDTNNLFSDGKIFTDSVRETDNSRYNEDETPLNISSIIVPWCSRGFRGASPLNWPTPMIPRHSILSENWKYYWGRFSAW